MMAASESILLESTRPMSIRAFAEAAETSPRRIRRLIRQGRLRTIMNQSGETRIPESELPRVTAWRDHQSLKQSMEVMPVPSPVSIPDLAEDGEYSGESVGAFISLHRHEAAMMRLGFLESELASSRKLLRETTD